MNGELTWKEGQKVPIFCIYGNHVWEAKTLDDLIAWLKKFDEYVEKAEPEFKAMWDEKAKASGLRLPKEIVREDMASILKKEGYLRLPCHDCNVRVSQAMWERMGIPTVLFDNMLIQPYLLNDEKFMEKLVMGDKMPRQMKRRLDREAKKRRERKT